MKDINSQSDQHATPEDVATLYSWANLHGAKYRDFSAARAQTREKARLRAEQATEEEQLHRTREPEAEHGAETGQAAEEAGVVEQADQEPAQQEQARDEQARQAEFAAEMAARQAERASQLAATQQAAGQATKFEAELAARRAAQEAAELAAQQAAQRVQENAAQRAEQQAALRAAELAAQQAAQQSAQQRAWQQPPPGRFPASPASSPATPSYPQQPQKIDFQDYPGPHAYQPPASQYPGQPQYGPVPGDRVREESSSPRNPWAAPDVREPAGRPAWLTTEGQETASPFGPQSGLPQAPSGLPQAQFAPPQAPEDTLQGSRDRLTSRWFAMRGVFDGTPAQAETLPPPMVSRVPAMAVFSLAGGVGKTSLVATLGRALSARGERVLLVDTAAFGLLPFFFGATDQRPGLLRTFNPPGTSSDAPIQMVTIDPEGLSAEQAGQESLSGEIAKFTRGANRVIVDLATASGATTRRIILMAPLVLVPVVADMNSVVSVSSIDAFFEHNSNAGGKPVLPYYVLNQFDATLPLHLDVREVLREQLGERLLPFALRRAPAMSEALAEGMTVMDYAPGSPLTEDFATLAGWVKSISAPATTSYRGVRWTERCG